VANFPPSWHATCAACLPHRRWREEVLQVKILLASGVIFTHAVLPLGRCIRACIARGSSSVGILLILGVWLLGMQKCCYCHNVVQERIQRGPCSARKLISWGCRHQDIVKEMPVWTSESTVTNAGNLVWKRISALGSHLRHEKRENNASSCDPEGSLVASNWSWISEKLLTN